MADEKRFERHPVGQYLQELLGREESLGPLETDASGEAEVAGPYEIRRQDGTYLVVGPGETVMARVNHYDTASLVAMALPSIGRDIVTLDTEPDETGEFALRAGTEVLGHLKLHLVKLPLAVSVLDLVRRSPLDLARFLTACGAESLERALRVITIMAQAPPQER